MSARGFAVPAIIAAAVLAGILWQLRSQPPDAEGPTGVQGRVGAPGGTNSADALDDTEGVAGPEDVAPEPASLEMRAARSIPPTLPDFELPSLSGAKRSLASYSSPALIVNFWATWCEPCRREIPLLQAARRDHASNGVEVVGIAVDFDATVRRYVAQYRIEYPMLLGEVGGLEAAKAFGMDLALPFTVFADAERRIVAVKVGELHANELDLILNAVFSINRGQLPIEAARVDVAQALHQLAEQRAVGTQRGVQTQQGLAAGKAP